MLDNFVFSNPFCLIFKDQMQHLIQHVQRQQYRCFNIEWVWCKLFEFSNFGDKILEQEGTVYHSTTNTTFAWAIVYSS